MQERLWEGEAIRYIDPALIHPNPSQPRRTFSEGELAQLGDSIRQYGVLQPLTVRLTSSGYELIAGERRLRAGVLAGCKRLPCLVVTADQKKSAEMAIIENLQRKDLDPFEEAEAISRLLDQWGMTQEQLAGRLSVSQSYIANKLRLMKFPAHLREQILAARLTERHCRAVLRIKDPEKWGGILAHIAKNDLTVARTEAYIDALLREQPKPRRHVRGAIKDLRIFYNSIDRALGIMRTAGMQTKCQKKETPDGVELTIRISRSS